MITTRMENRRGNEMETKVPSLVAGPPTPASMKYDSVLGLFGNIYD